MEFLLLKQAANGVFTVKTAYSLLFKDQGRHDPFWDMLW